MKTISKTVLTALVFATAIYSCKNAQNDNFAEAALDSTAVESSIASSNAAREPKNSNKKFIRTADIKFRVKNVPSATYAIENAVSKFGGYVTYTDLKSEIIDKSIVKINQENTLETTKYSVVNQLSIRVPNTKLDTVIKLIAKQIDFLDSREIKADEVSLKLIENELLQTRKSKHVDRLAKAIATKGKKLNEIIIAENDLETKNAENDNNKIETNLINDQVNFSTLTLNIYQKETIKQDLIVNPKIYREDFGSRIFDGLKTGWYMIEAIIAFFIQLWAVFLIGFVIYFFYKKFLRK
jgi:hypothetical protein